MSIPLCGITIIRRIKNSTIAKRLLIVNMCQALCQALHICELIWLNEVMHRKCLAQDSWKGSDNDDDKEIDDDSLGPMSLVHPLTGRTEWPLKFQEGGGLGWMREKKANK